MPTRGSADWCSRNRGDPISRDTRVFLMRQSRGRKLLHRTGATLGVLAILFQVLVFAFHRPAQAAVLLPFNDPGAWCGAGSGGSPSDQGDPKSHQHGVLVCPICQTLHVAATGLVPVLAALVAPVSSATPLEAAAETGSSEPFGHSAANPSGPPALS